MPCDTFVALPNVTEHQSVIFGKNADRVDSEVQEVVYVPAATYTAETKVKIMHVDIPNVTRTNSMMANKPSWVAREEINNVIATQCTYIEIAQATRTHAVVLSKPCWMWGAEMGANEHGVCIGNEAVWTKVQEDDEKRLLGMDLVRLGLERAETAQAAVEVITTLLETHGQGGPCFIDPSCAGMTYHNSFLVADPAEAWVLETAGKHWAAHKCTAGVRNISNELSIGTDMTLRSAGLQEYARDQGWWDGTSPFSFKHAYSSGTGLFSGKFEHSVRFQNGCKLLETKSAQGQFNVKHMMEILRDEKADICWTGSGFVTTGSQVSVLYSGSKPKLSHHWFTATPNPACSVFKPFIFVPEAAGSKITESTSNENSHELHKAHARIKPLPGYDVNVRVCKLLPGIEEKFIKEVTDLVENYDDSRLSQMTSVFKDAVEEEMKLYSI